MLSTTNAVVDVRQQNDQNLLRCLMLTIFRGSGAIPHVLYVYRIYQVGKYKYVYKNTYYSRAITLIFLEYYFNYFTLMLMSIPIVFVCLPMKKATLPAKICQFT